MMKFLTHEPIKDGWFNAQFTSGFGQFSAWEKQLSNSPEVMSLLCQRMEADYLQTRENKRKAYNLGARAFCVVRECFAESAFELRKCSNDFVHHTTPVFLASRLGFQTTSLRRRPPCWKRRCLDCKDVPRCALFHDALYSMMFF